MLVYIVVVALFLLVYDQWFYPDHGCTNSLQNLIERLMQGPIGDKVRIEYVDKINELDKQCNLASESITALSPKAPSPAAQASY